MAHDLSNLAFELKYHSIYSVGLNLSNLAFDQFERSVALVLRAESACCRFKDERFDDRSMEADWRSIQAEEKRSARLGRTEDEKAELEELAHQKAKAARKRAKPSKGFILD